MSAISSVSNPSLGYVAPIAVDSPTVSSNFSQTLAVAQAPNSWLTTAEASRANRPNIRDFMDRSGATFLDASELLHGVVGSNTDVRDWTAIMASNDPISAARQATAQMYGRTDITPRTDATYMGAADTVAKEGNFAIRQLRNEQGKVVDQGLKLINAQGLLLRDAGSTPKNIARNAWLFGFDTKLLSKLAEAAGTVSESLGKAVAQAGQMDAVSAARQTSTFKPAAAAHSGTNVMAPPEAVSRSLLRAAAMPSNDRGSAPALEQAATSARAHALAHVDSSTYLHRLFKA